MKPFRFSFAGSRVVLFVLVSFGVLLQGSRAVYANPLFSVQSVGSLASGSALPTGINDSGSAVGFSMDAFGSLHPVAFSGGSALPLPGSGEATGINDSGTIIGSTFNGYKPTVTEWSSGQPINLNIQGYGTSISNAGQVAGSYVGASGQAHAFIWDRGALKDLGTLGGTWSAASAINGKGQAAGTSSLANGAFEAFFYDGSRMLSLGTLGGENSYASAVNNRGEVAGTSQIASGYLNAFTWTSAGLMDLGTLGGSSSSAYGVNDTGEVVGYSQTAKNAETHGFLDQNGVMLDLNSLIPAASGWTITAAYAINSAGLILGTGSFGGELYAVELDPAVLTPEPTSLVLVGAGMVAIAKARKTRIKQSASV